MVDFVLRHGNDLLAVECLRGFEVRADSRTGTVRQVSLGNTCNIATPCKYNVTLVSL